MQPMGCAAAAAAYQPQYVPRVGVMPLAGAAGLRARRGLQAERHCVRRTAVHKPGPPWIGLQRGAVQGTNKQATAATHKPAAGYLQSAASIQ